MTHAKSVTEYHLCADSTAHASALLAGCTNLTRIMVHAEKVIRDGAVIKTRDITPPPVQAVVVAPMKTDGGRFQSKRPNIANKPQ